MSKKKSSKSVENRSRIEVAREAGVDMVECPHCQAKFKTDDLFRLFFEKIVDIVSSGRRVNIAKFGIFRLHEIKGKLVKSPIIPAGVCSKDRKIIKWRASDHIRRVLNPALKSDPEHVAKMQESKDMHRADDEERRAKLRETKLKKRRVRE